MAAYLFLLGLASGVALLAISSFRQVTPAWLKWALTASGLLVIARYVTLAIFTSSDAPQRFWGLRHVWFGSAIGLTFPSAFAVDQLIRHPAMTPKKLLRWVAPFLVAYGAVMLFGTYRPEPAPVVGWTLHLSAPWRVFVSAVQGAFAAGFIGIGAMLMRKIPSRPIQLGLLGLLAGQTLLGLDGLIVALGGWYVRPFLFSEMVMCLAIWHAFETAADSR